MQPLPLPDLNRQTPASIDEALDMPRKWTLWGRGDYMDSIICCKLFPERCNAMSDAEIAKALSKLHRPCGNMTWLDVAELWRFLERYPDMHTNSIRSWRAMKDEEGALSKDDEGKVTQAVGRFRSQVPVPRNQVPVSKNQVLYPKDQALPAKDQVPVPEY